MQVVRESIQIFSSKFKGAFDCLLIQKKPKTTDTTTSLAARMESDTGRDGKATMHEGEEHSRFPRWTLEARQQFVAFALGLHSRCGANSAVRHLVSYDSHVLREDIGKRWIMGEDRKVIVFVESGVHGGGAALSLSWSHTYGNLGTAVVCVLEPGTTVIGFAGPRTVVFKTQNGVLTIRDTVTCECVGCPPVAFDAFASNGKWAILHYCGSGGFTTMMVWPCGKQMAGSCLMAYPKMKWLEFTDINPAIPEGDEVSMFGEINPGVQGLWYMDLGKAYAEFMNGGNTPKGSPLRVKGITTELKLQRGILKRGAAYLIPVHKSNGAFSFTELHGGDKLLPHEWNSAPQKVDETHFAVTSRDRTLLSVYCTNDLSRPCYRIPLSRGSNWCSSGNGFISMCDPLAGYLLYESSLSTAVLMTLGFGSVEQKENLRTSLYSFGSANC
ncbi:hypothetical protein Pelo_12508 [Pelomyxa schiedti]|nr:hypothetical protein Pelo_12508 [Pelomyxa schiedti]